MKNSVLSGLVLAVVLAFMVGGAASGQTTPFRASVLADNLERPWGIDFLPGGDALLTERDTGRLLRVTPEGKMETVQVIPEQGEGEGGLLGLAVSPGYATDGLVYAYVTGATDNRVVRFRLGGAPQPVLTGIPKGRTHNGGRIAFGPDGKLYVGTGDAGDTGLSQNRRSLGGKVLRVNPGGTVPADNPFGNAVWSYGHRNVQGLAWDARGRMYATELGQNAFDEVNRIAKGKNYGWPRVEGKSKNRRFKNPVAVFSPETASPSGAAIYRGDAIPGWNGDLLFAALRGERLWKLDRRADGTIRSRTAFLTGTYGRLRAVEQAPDGSVWLLTTNGSNDKVVRLASG
ncbi:PQQ-dependent sugar dehydrogenase [Rubrobacter indicoceani]|uniref:PQQ-dependent sugar dehydrogenase n=1 Tax=Rubrobacter indicoceani TaxID=2051957 RepID=UPI001968D315|nr:PQQ-dependent sugar dehydrogenase [Rubrobacter indicoceani]